MTKTTLETTQSLVGTGVSPYYMELKQHGMLQSMGSQRVGHDLATEQQKNSMCLLWAPQMLRQDLGEMRWLWSALGQHYQEVNRTGKGRRQKGEAPSKLCRWELWCNPSLCTTPPKLEFSDEQKGNWSLTIPVPNPLGGHEQNLVCTRTQGKGAVPPQKTDPDLSMSVQESLAELWVSGGLCRVGALSAAVPGTCGGGHHYLHYLHHSLVSGQTTRSEHSPAHQQKVGLQIYWAWLHSLKQHPVTPSVSLSHQEASISLLSFSIRG